jgi:hypothetical protein
MHLDYSGSVDHFITALTRLCVLNIPENKRTAISPYLQHHPSPQKQVPSACTWITVEVSITSLLL